MSSVPYPSVPRGFWLLVLCAAAVVTWHWSPPELALAGLRPPPGPTAGLEERMHAWLRLLVLASALVTALVASLQLTLGRRSDAR